ncbi:hypothetical protein CLV47_1325 [Antricoccus suffuscus]|uniref:Roadblock/LC7 domain-containing protein n=2 Tax=Antricoccus suffuscus TaxID=1629062 RepID=A0A2T0Z013_9ACTN|nr:hypothetical protein CLV47_1325 [Antricoccus suffuscus]
MTPEGEQEWISDLLDPLHGHDDNGDNPIEGATTASATIDPADSPSAPSADGPQRRSVADVIAAAEPVLRQPTPERSGNGEPDDVSAPKAGDSTTDDDNPAATRSAADVLAAANRTGEATVPTTTDSAAELPADYAARVPTTGEIPAVDETRTNVAPTLAEIMQIDGALGTALVDYASGETLACRSTEGGPDMPQAAAGESAVIRTKIASLVQLDSDDDVDEVFTTLGAQYHLSRMVPETETAGLFLYLILDRPRANLAMARHKLALAARQLEA